MNIIELAQILKRAHEIVDDKWKSLSPEQKARIVDNITKKAKERAEAKKKGGDK